MILRRALLLGLLMATAQPSPVAAAERPDDQKTALTALAAAAQNNDCKAAAPIVAQQAGSARFADLPDPVRRDVYRIGTFCAFAARELDLALRYAEVGTRISGADNEFWKLRFQLTWQAKRTADAVTVVEEMARNSPDALMAISIGTWSRTYLSLKAQGDMALTRRLLAVLTNPAYVLGEARIGSSIDGFRQGYAGILTDAGDKDGAAAMLALIDSPGALMGISVDTRLKALLPASYDARSSVERHMARMREIAAAHANVMRPQINVVTDLLWLGKGEEALRTLEVIDPLKAGAPAYADKDELLPWWWDSKARAYAQLGRYPEAIEAYSQGKALNEYGQPNISQTINMAGLQLVFGHPADAIETLAPIAAGSIKGSLVGMMQFRDNRGCASYRLGRLADAKADLAYLRDHFAEGPELVTDLELCMGDVDAAAASVIKRLETPNQRVQALLDLSDYAPPPATYPADPSAEALAALKRRADVRAAADRAGGTRSFNVLVSGR
ncbi:hypothetical protein KRR38_08015 [Novosphingobium sp. G106]|uniref:hypothetical protein n=1 Tax=Novosphingobium sp. G106 TaxID=2849500 RepID=UPI001C2D1374|nr:hypothetical protein [Novosphingobium sp. G106]MBV1687626.1 hypothetical protein [Novosphingobium sp. G106]